MSERPSVGLDVGGTEIKWATVVDGVRLASGSAPTPRGGVEEVVEAICELAAGVDSTAVGLALPATIDLRTRTVELLPNIPGSWSGYPIGEAIESRLGRPVAVLNDARAFGFAELWAGAAADAAHALFITVGTGVGGAIARDRTILLGDLDAIGELGHVCVEPQGALCGCGGRGCLETVASGSAIVAGASRALLAGLSPALVTLTGGSLAALTPRVVAEAAAAGDLHCLEVVRRAGSALGTAASVACTLMNLSTIVVGGGVASMFDLLRPHVEVELIQRTSLTGPISLRPAALGPVAGAIGAALYACSRAATEAVAS